MRYAGARWDQNVALRAGTSRPSPVLRARALRSIGEWLAWRAAHDV